MTPGRVVDLPVGDLCTGDDHLPGIDRAHLAALLDGTRDDKRPVDVVPAGPGLWRITNGRHRWLAALIAGRPTVPAQLRQ